MHTHALYAAITNNYQGVFYTLPREVNTPNFRTTSPSSSPDNPPSSQGVLNVTFTVLSWSDTSTHDTRGLPRPDLRLELDTPSAIKWYRKHPDNNTVLSYLSMWNCNVICVMSKVKQKLTWMSIFTSQMPFLLWKDHQLLVPRPIYLGLCTWTQLGNFRPPFRPPVCGVQKTSLS